MAEKKDFRLHKAALFSIIVAQAGTLEKALLELVMNAVDAGSTRVEVDLTNTTFRVSDDGRGFAGEQEIEHYFGTFGTPHVEGDATYGKFRMGRGQIMAFTQNTWRSNDFRMEVDIKNAGDHYVFHKGLPQHVGCTIEGTLYDALGSADRLTVERNLAEMVQYVAIDVMLNGVLVSKKHLAQKWTFEDENAYYLLQANRDRLAIYNLGVLVKEGWASDFGMGGVILSKKRLTVNMARNDILVSQCPVWKAIGKRIRAYVSEHSRSDKVVKNESWKQMMCRRLASGTFEATDNVVDLCEEKLFTLIDGKSVSLYDLAARLASRRTGKEPPVLVMAQSDNDIRADQAHAAGFAVVLSSKMASRFGLYGQLSTLFERIEQGMAAAAQAHHPALKEVLKNQVTWGSFLAMFRNLAARCAPLDILQNFEGMITRTVADKDLSKDALAVLEIVRRAQGSMVYGVARAIDDRNLIPREILAGQSEANHAWTDGKSRIWLDLNELHVPGGSFSQVVASATRVATLLVHEYLHTDNSLETLVHGPEFYERYERATCGTDVIGRFASMFVTLWAQDRLKQAKASAQKKLRASEAKTIALLEQMGENVEEGPGEVSLPKAA